MNFISQTTPTHLGGQNGSVRKEMNWCMWRPCLAFIITLLPLSGMCIGSCFLLCLKDSQVEPCSGFIRLINEFDQINPCIDLTGNSSTVIIHVRVSTSI